MEMALSVHLDSDYETALTQVTDALKTEGFGVLTSIDMKKTLKEKLDVEYPRYAILGACNPPIAHKALNVTPDVGLVLPCNVVVAENASGGTDVSFMNPVVMMDVLPQADLKPLADDVYARLERVTHKLMEN
jgi:uncharacterized protein (DUF302 family)